MEQKDIQVYEKVQNIAKATIDYLKQSIKQGMSENDIANLANAFMTSNSIESFWYYGVGSLILVGPRTTLSISGRNYNPSGNVIVSDTDLVTIDLSPQIGTYWGDFARSLVIDNGHVVDRTDGSLSELANELFTGLETEKRLHHKLEEIALPEMTFEELYKSMNQFIEQLGHQNLDFKGNLGHTIERDKNNRIYIEEGCKKTLGGRLFTFEPHIKRINGEYGFKREDIYYFCGQTLRRL